MDPEADASPRPLVEEEESPPPPRPASPGALSARETGQSLAGTPFGSLLEVAQELALHPGVSAALLKISEARDHGNLREELKKVYPESSQLQAFAPEPLGDVEAYLRSSSLALSGHHQLRCDQALAALGEAPRR